MAEKETKLGPNVTYVGNDENDKQSVTMNNIRFKPGDSVNLEERLGKPQAQAMLAKLAGNPFFKVDGGPDHKKMKEERDKAEQEAAEQERKAAEEEQADNPNYQAPDQAQLEGQQQGARQASRQQQPPQQQRPQQPPQQRR